MANSIVNKQLQIDVMPLRRADYRIVAIASMEQIIGTGLSAVIGIMIPMMIMVMGHGLSAFLQGMLGAIGLIGIAIGSMVIGRLSDKQGYLRWFRLCPVIIVAGSLICFFIPNVAGLLIGLPVIGFGVGGGYSLDSSYISELMPEKWKMVMVGIAKATCCLGFIGVAVVCYIILLIKPDLRIWNSLILIIAALGVLTFLLRLRWYESPEWLIAHGRTAEADKAAKQFLGDDILPSPVQTKGNNPRASSWRCLFSRKNIGKVIYSGIPWACEGLAVYGFGVFMPMLLMALGFGESHHQGILKITESIKMTSVVNFFMLPGFVVGLLMMRKVSHGKMMTTGFLACSVGLGILLLAYLLHLAAWTMVLGFLIFEFFLNWGPHLITYIIPSYIYPVSERGAGNGVAAMLGKVGAVAGVFLMPLLLHHGGMTLVLIVSIAVMLLGAAISYLYRNVGERRGQVISF